LFASGFDCFPLFDPNRLSKPFSLACVVTFFLLTGLLLSPAFESTDRCVFLVSPSLFGRTWICCSIFLALSQNPPGTFVRRLGSETPPPPHRSVFPPHFRAMLRGKKSRGFFFAFFTPTSWIDPLVSSWDAILLFLGFDGFPSWSPSLLVSRPVDFLFSLRTLILFRVSVPPRLVDLVSFVLLTPGVPFSPYGTLSSLRFFLFEVFPFPAGARTIVLFCPSISFYLFFLVFILLFPPFLFFFFFCE